LEVRDEVRQLAGPLAEDEGYELVDVELVFQGRRKVIRVLLDKPGGINVSDCARFSRKLADCLDMNQTVSGSYLLEVSSPGIERPLRTLDAVRRFAGHRASITLHTPRDGRRNFDGELLSPDGERVGVRTDEGETHTFEWAEVRSARLVVDPWADLRQRPERQGGARARAAWSGERPRGGAR
jgi:ribosome maturation factor RimP